MGTVTDIRKWKQARAQDPEKELLKELEAALNDVYELVLPSIWQETLIEIEDSKDELDFSENDRGW